MWGEDQSSRNRRERSVDRARHNPKLRNAILEVTAELEQIIDEVSKDALLFAGQSQAAKEKAKTALSNFRQFIEDNKDEIDALQILNSRPCRSAGWARRMNCSASSLEASLTPCTKGWRHEQEK